MQDRCLSWQIFKACRLGDRVVPRYVQIGKARAETQIQRALIVIEQAHIFIGNRLHRCGERALEVRMVEVEQKYA